MCILCIIWYFLKKNFHKYKLGCLYNSTLSANENEKQTIPHSTWTVPKSNRTIIERGKIDNPNTQIHYRRFNKEWQGWTSYMCLLLVKWCRHVGVMLLWVICQQSLTHQNQFKTHHYVSKSRHFSFMCMFCRSLFVPLYFFF